MSGPDDDGISAGPATYESNGDRDDDDENNDMNISLSPRLHRSK